MKTNEEKPWYHGVRFSVTPGKKFSEELFITDGVRNDGNGGRICRMWNGRTMRDQYAELFAAAPETAEERDSLRKRVCELEAQNRRLVSAVEEGILTLYRGKKQGRVMAEMYEALDFKSKRVEQSRPFESFGEEEIKEAKRAWRKRQRARSALNPQGE